MNLIQAKSDCMRNNRIMAMAIILAAFLFISGQLTSAMAAGTAATIPASFADVAEQASPAVVNISTERTSGGESGPMAMPFGGDERMREFFDHFFGGQMPRGRPHKQQALGTGFIIDPSGLIITNNHVVEGADTITVRMTNEKEYDAELLGRDPKTDLALIKIKDGNRLPFLKLGDSDQTRVGDWVVAIGNPFGLEHTVTSGILSARGRVIGAGPYDDFLQTDASINPGNSGGPLLNLDGEVIGINTAIVAQGQGIGFAIPTTLAKNIIDQLKDKGKVVRGWLGVMIQNVTPELAKSFDLKDAHGALVADVTEDGPAEKAGIKRGDIIVEFNGQKIEDSGDLPALVASTPVGEKVEVKVVRDGKEKTIDVKLGELQEDATMPGSQKPRRGLGLTVQELTPEMAQRLGLSETKGLVITGIEDDSPAADSGLKPGDLILEINREQVKTMSDFRRLADASKSGDNLLFLVKRGNNTLFFTLEAK